VSVSAHHDVTSSVHRLLAAVALQFCAEPETFPVFRAYMLARSKDEPDVCQTFETMRAAYLESMASDFVESLLP
jgi:hypothetical protein